MKDILLNKKVKLTSNLFSNNSICELGITFLYRDMKYSYDIKYDTKLNQFIYESLTSKDMGVGRSKKKELLAFFINDIENLK